MPGYTKLFSSIVHSTIWREPHHVRLVWITMLAISDKNGIVEASIPGLADLSRVTLDECKDALNRMQQPDEYSRSTDHEGRRIGCVDGGWLLLNHAKYRERLKADDERERKRIWWEENRGKGKLDAPSETSENSTGLEKPSLPDPSPTSSSTPTSKSSKNIYTPDFETFWKAYPRGDNKKGAYIRWKQIEKTRPPLTIILQAIRIQSQGRQWQAGVYPHAKTWLHNERWNDETEKATGFTVGRPQPKNEPEVDDGPVATPEQRTAAMKEIRDKLGMNPFTTEGEE